MSQPQDRRRFLSLPTSSKRPETTCPSGSGCFLPESGKHPLAFWAESERREDADPISDEGREQTCVKALISHIQPILLNAPSKRVCGEGWLWSKANTPPVCTPRQMCAGLQAWPAPRSRAGYLFSQFKALAATHAASAGHPKRS